MCGSATALVSRHKSRWIAKQSTSAQECYCTMKIQPVVESHSRFLKEHTVILSSEHEMVCEKFSSYSSEHVVKMKARFSAFGFCYQDDALPLNPLILDASVARQTERDLQVIVEAAREVSMRDSNAIDDLRPDQKQIVENSLHKEGFAPMVARPDAVLVEGELKILELNVDSGVGGVQEITEIQSFIKTSEASYELEIHSPLQRQVEFIKRVALSIDNIQGPPRVSILIYKHFPDYFITQSHLLATMISEDGSVVAKVDFPDDLSISEYVSDGPTDINLIYRDGSAQYEGEKFSEMGRVLLGAVGTKTLLVADPRDLAVEDKGVLALLSQKADIGELSDEVCRLVHKYIPWTRNLSLICQEQVSSSDYLISSKDELVLKRKFSDKGRHVVVGLAKTASEWAEAVDLALDEPTGWIVQKYLKPDSVQFAFDYEGEIRHEDREITLGPYMFGDNAQTWLVRIQRGENTHVLARLLSGGYGMTGVAYK